MRGTARITAATAGAISLTGDPRRWAAEPGLPGVVHVPDPYHGIQRGWDSGEAALATLEEIIQLEGPRTIAGFILEPVTGTNGVLIPPDGYLQGVRALCDKHGIVHDRRRGDVGLRAHGGVVRRRSLERRARHHDDGERADERLCPARRGRACGGRSRIISDDRVFSGGLTYNSHPLACATALATIAVYEEDRLIERAKATGALMADLLTDLQARHPSVGAVRSIGLFGIVELIRNRTTREPMAPFNGTSPEMAALGRFFRQEGLYTFVRWNTFFTNPPLTITEDELREGFAIIDRGVTIADRACV